MMQRHSILPTLCVESSVKFISPLTESLIPQLYVFKMAQKIAIVILT